VATRAPARDQFRAFEVFPKNARQLRVEGVVLQERDFSCGAAALSTICRFQWGGKETETEILTALLQQLTVDELKERIENGLTLTDLRRLAAGFGYQTLLGRLPLEKLRDSKIPLIMGITHRGYNHFVVFRGMDKDFVYIADPAAGKVRMLIREFESEWQRNAVLVVIKPGGSLARRSPLMATDEERSLGYTNWLFIQNYIVPRANRF
jgi:predicted double-glycine peptidase